MTLAVDEAMAAARLPLPLAVAFSGGADSTALLGAAVQRWPGRIRAVHVHHGLQAAADDFEQHCRSLCKQWSVPLVVCRVQAGHGRGESPEAAARVARYRALIDAVRSSWLDDPTQAIAVAQHADDQVETLILALSRGAGLPGLAGMPARWTREGMLFLRPLLQVSRPEIEQWLQRQQIGHATDPSNVDERYTRNRIRRHVLPALQKITPQWRDTLARSAAHLAQAQELLREVALEDLSRAGTPPRLVALQKLSRPRCANVLRAWLAAQCQAAASAAQLEELLDQVQACVTRGHKIHLKVGAGHVLRVGERLQWQAPAPASGLPG